MFDFPNNPTNGQTVTGPNGVLYVWDGAKWHAQALPDIYAPLNSPVFTGNPTAPTPPQGDASPSLATTAFVNGAMQPAFINTGRNLLHNPRFNVAQRGTGPFASRGMTADRWQMFFAAPDTMSTSIVAATDANRSARGDEAITSCLQVNVAGSATAGAYTQFAQRMENVRRLGNKTIIVSGWASANPAAQLGVSVDQLFGTGGSPSAGAYGTGQAVTLSTTLTRFVMPIVIPSTAGKVLGSNGDDFTQINLWLSASSTYEPAAGIGAQTSLFTLVDLQVEVVPSGTTKATPFDAPDPVLDYNRCLRFYCHGQAAFSGYATAGVSVSATSSFPATMRASPTITVTNNDTNNVSGFSATALNPDALYLAGTAVANGATSLNVTYTASAEL